MNPAGQSGSTVPIEIAPAEAAEAIAAGGDLVVVDCRRPEEHAYARIACEQVLIPIEELGARVEELREFAGRPMIVYCHHGRRSLLAARFLRERGFDGARSLAGGTEAWSRLIDPSVPRY